MRPRTCATKRATLRGVAWRPDPACVLSTANLTDDLCRQAREVGIEIFLAKGEVSRLTDTVMNLGLSI